MRKGDNSMRKRNLINKKFVAAVTVVSMTTSLCACSNDSSDKKDNDSAKQPEQATENITATGEGYGSKDETVYVVTSGDGNVTSVEVVDWLKNEEGIKDLKDATILENIKNLKGNETFTNNNGLLTFETNGKDIYYQGTCDASNLPFTYKVEYKLDGEVITADELKGKSGKLEIKVTITSVKQQTVEVDGTEYEVYVPFMGITGAMLSTDKFSNVSIDNGKIISNSEYQVVCGFAVAGVKENLDNEELAEKFGFDSFTITADVEDFSTPYMMSYVGNQILDKIDVSSVNGIKDMLGKIGELTTGSSQLMNGAGQLYDGLVSLAKGANTLNDGIVTLGTGAGKLDDGAKDLKDGAGKLDNGAKDLYDGAVKVDEGFGTLQTGIGTLQTGMNTIDGGFTSLVSGVDKLDAGVKKLASNNTALTKATTTLTSSISTLNTGVSSLNTGAKKLNDNMKKFYKAAGELPTGTKQLSDGLKLMKSKLATMQTELTTQLTQYKTLVAQNKSLIDGVNTAVSNGISLSAVAASKNISETALLTSVEQYYQAVGAVAALETIAAKFTTKDATTNMTITESVDALVTGATKIDTGANSVYENAKKLYDEGTNVLATNIGTLASKVEELDTKSQEYGKSVKAYVSGVATIYSSMPDLVSGVKKLDDGVDQVVTGISSLSTGAKTLKDGTSSLATGAKTLKDGTSSLLAGTKTLKDGTSSLVDGVDKLGEGSNKLVDGADKLKDGAKQLDEGITKLVEEGINKITAAVENVSEDDLAKIKAVITSAGQYNTISSNVEGQDSSVKFIVKTN